MSITFTALAIVIVAVWLMFAYVAGKNAQAAKRLAEGHFPDHPATASAIYAGFVEAFGLNVSQLNPDARLSDFGIDEEWEFVEIAFMLEAVTGGDVDRNVAVEFISLSDIVEYAVDAQESLKSRR